MKSLKILLVFIIIYKCRASIVPVYMWGSIEGIDNIPALSYLNKSSFKDILEQEMEHDTFLLIFARKHLNIEDLAPLETDIKGRYLPNVESPMDVIEHLPSKRFRNVLIDRARDFYKFGYDGLIVNFDSLDDVSTMLNIYKDLQGRYKCVLAMITGYESLQIKLSQKREGKLFATNNIMFYIGGPLILRDRKGNETSIEIQSGKQTPEFADDNFFNLNMSLGSKPEFGVSFEISFMSGYWHITHFIVDKKGEFRVDDVYAPIGYSFHCQELKIFTNRFCLILPEFQIQYVHNTTSNGSRFDEAWDCMGATTAPIWSGILVSFLMITVFLIGLKRLAGIKRMDRFDDPKGQFLTYNLDS